MDISGNVEILNMIFLGSRLAVERINFLCNPPNCELSALLDAHEHMAYLAEKELHYLGREPVELYGAEAETAEFTEKLGQKNLLPGYRRLAESYIALQRQYSDVVGRGLFTNSPSHTPSPRGIS